MTNIFSGDANEIFLKTSTTLPFFAADCEHESDVYAGVVCEQQKCVQMLCFMHSLLLPLKFDYFFLAYIKKKQYFCNHKVF